MKKTKFKFAVALLVLLGLAVAVVAVMQSGSQLLSAAGQQEIKDTRTKDLALDALAPASLKKVKSAAVKKSPAKTEATSAAGQAKPPADAASLDQKHQELALLIDQAERERSAAKKVGEPTKQAILALKVELSALYRAKADEAMVASDPERVAFYQAAAKKIETVALAACKDSPQPADAAALGDASGPETRAFNAALKKTDKNSLSAEQKNTLYDVAAAPLLKSINVFCSLYTTAMSLAQQLQNVAAGRAMGTGCSPAAGAPGVPSPDLGLVQAVLGLVRETILGYRESLLELQTLTGRAMNVPSLPAPVATKLVVPTEDAQKKEKDEAKTIDEKQVDFMNKVSPNPGGGGGPGGHGGGGHGGGGGGGH